MVSEAINSTVVNPQVYNYGYIAKKLSAEQYHQIEEIVRPLNDGTNRGDLIVSMLGDSNSQELAEQLVEVFKSAGWNVGGASMAVMINPPGPLFCSWFTPAASTPDGQSRQI